MAVKTKKEDGTENSTKEKSVKETMKKTREVKMYTKTEILSSERYRGRRDVLDALLQREKSYALTEVEELMRDFLKGKVK